MPQRNADGIQATKTALRIIDLLKDSNGAGVTELAQRTGVSKSTVHRHLTTLQDEQYVVKEGSTYKLGYRFLEMGGYVRSRDVSELIKTKVTQLGEETGERSQYVVEEYGYGIFAYIHTGESSVETGVELGKRTPLHLTSAGKAILAHLPEDQIEHIVESRPLRRRTSNSITDEATLYDELEMIREQGYAIDEGEFLEGLSCVGVPVRKPEGGTLGALSIAGPKYRMQELIDADLPHQVMGTANELELKITHE